MMNEPGPLQGPELDFLRVVSAHGAHTWLIAQGLVAVLDDLRARTTDTTPIPVPGTRKLLDQITDGVTEATNLLDAAVIKAESEDLASNRGAGGRFAPGRRSDRDRAGDGQVPPRLEAVGVSIVAADRFARQVAQLVLGATSYLAGTDDVARVERAAVEVLAPVRGPKTPLTDDGIELFGADREQLQIEVAGTICRLLIDWGGTVALRTPNGATIALEVSGDTLHVSLQGAEQIDTLNAGWRSQGPGWFVRSWASPVTVAEAGREIVRVLFDILEVPGAADVTAELPTDAAEDSPG
jgi:hypothetical protein